MSTKARVQICVADVEIALMHTPHKQRWYADVARLAKSCTFLLIDTSCDMVNVRSVPSSGAIIRRIFAVRCLHSCRSSFVKVESRVRLVRRFHHFLFIVDATSTACHSHCTYHQFTDTSSRVLDLERLICNPPSSSYLKFISRSISRIASNAPFANRDFPTKCWLALDDRSLNLRSQSGNASHTCRLPIPSYTAVDVEKSTRYN